MKTKRISFEVEVHDDVTDDDLLQWARFHLNEVASLKGTNTLTYDELEAVYQSTRIER